MSTIWVNGDMKNISERAYAKLSVLDKEEGVCGKMDLSFGRIGFLCTRGVGHKGAHVAHGGDTVCSVWTERRDE